MIFHRRHRRGRGLRGPRIAAALALIVVFGAGSLYYSRTHKPTTASSTTPPTGHVQSYHVRGRIEDLPDPARPASGLAIHHEEIKNFARKDGTLGMSSMTMDFPYAKSVSLAGLAIGDKIEFTLEVNWAGFPMFQVTTIAKLPADTVLTVDPLPAK